MGKFQKGKSGNKFGRPKGVPNTVTTELREVLTLFLVDAVTDLPTIFNSLKADQKIDALVKIAAYVLPKLSTLTIEPGMTIDRFIRLPEADREVYLAKLRLELEKENNLPPAY